MKNEKILVTSALPYANGAIHFGHIAGAYLPADIFVRFKKLVGADVLYVCGTDEHGFAITASAIKEGRSPQDHVDHYHKVIVEIFQKFQIEFDHFSRTTRPHHYELSQQFFTQLLQNGYISSKVTDQLYDESINLFLADRYIEGTCPLCGFEKARGDECGGCGQWMDPLKLINPICTLTGKTPIIKATQHWFLELGKFSEKLKNWMGEKNWKPNVTKFIDQMIEQGLEARPITRDMDWGIPVPLEDAQGKVLYVWFDAPIGYISSTMEWAAEKGQPELWKDYWYNKDCKLVHFIGKDNLPFHCVVWPSVIMGQNEPFILPTDVPANEFYNLEGKQFSKSTGWTIDIDDFFSKYQVDSIRYAIAVNAPETKDAAFSWQDFLNRHNGELADCLGNFVNRTLKFTVAYFEGKIPIPGPKTEVEERLLTDLSALSTRLTEAYGNYQVRKASFEAMEIARLGNRYFDEKAPWKSRKNNPADCGTAIYFANQLVKALALAFYPIIPQTSQKIWGFLNLEREIGSKNWAEEWSTYIPVETLLKEPQVLFEKIEEKQIQSEIEKLHQFVEASEKQNNEKTTQVNKSSDQKNTAPNSDAKTSSPVESLPGIIEIGDFQKVHLQVGQIVSAEEIKKSDKLLKLQVNIGHEVRQVVAGIRQYYQDLPALVGLKVLVVTNLKPSILRGVESQGMILAAKDSQGLKLIQAPQDCELGARVA